MKSSREKLLNMSLGVAIAFLASGILTLFSGERGWLKLFTWAVFFTASLSPFFYAKNSNLNCFLFSRSKREADIGVGSYGNKALV
jgi:hypothetical protein